MAEHHHPHLPNPFHNLPKPFQRHHRDGTDREIDVPAPAPPPPSASSGRPHPGHDHHTEDISSLCPQIHGPVDWSPLLYPELDHRLRSEIIKYGEFTQTTYDGFDADSCSRYCGSCLYGRDRLFAGVDLADHGYVATLYLYAMADVNLPTWLKHSLHEDENTWNRDSNWMGYVAVSNDHESRRIGCRDILVAWRGTLEPSEWAKDTETKLVPFGPEYGDDVLVEQGFKSIYTTKSEASPYNNRSASEQVMAEIKRLVDHFRRKRELVSLTLVGHSLGASLALLTALEAATTWPDLPVTVITFGCPRTGNEAFVQKVRTTGIVKVLRNVVKQDVVPTLPGLPIDGELEKLKLVVTGSSAEFVYAHVGQELGLDVESSPYLNHKKFDILGFHNLEMYLHLVDGYKSQEDRFRHGARRDVALVNKSSSMLRPEEKVPESWYQPAANKGMVRDAQGKWVQPLRAPEDLPVPPVALPFPELEARLAERAYEELLGAPVGFATSVGLFPKK